MVARTWFRRPPYDDGKPTFCIMCLHVNNECAKRPGIALDLMLHLRVLTVENRRRGFQRRLLATPWARQHHPACLCKHAAASLFLACRRSGVRKRSQANGQTVAASSSRLGRTESGSSRSTELFMHGRTALGVSAKHCDTKRSRGALQPQRTKRAHQGRR